jgi:membrane-bound serine protease (ClpP class)
VLRRLSLLLLVIAAALGVVPAAAQESDAGPVAVADVRGPLDQRAIDFLVDVISNEDAQLIVLKIDNPGVASGDLAELVAAIRTSGTPVVAWVGPDGAVAYGDVAQLLDDVAVVGASPGARIGFVDPSFEGEIDLPEIEQTYRYQYRSEMVVGPGGTGEDAVPEHLAATMIVEPTIGQFIAALDGTDVATSLGNVTLETAMDAKLDDGTDVTVSSVPVRFLKPTLLTRFLRLGTRPDATLFFLLAGLAAAAFEFYAAGAGVAAAVGVLSLFLAGYGFATLPMNWPAVVAAVIGIGLYTWDFQRHELGIRSGVGTLLMLGGGFWLVGGTPQISTNWWAVVLTVVGIMLFYLFAMTTIVRSRFGTPTLGREHLVGMAGIAETSLHPDGVVVIDGAKWRARAHRAAGVEAGSDIEVLAVEGITLQVAPRQESS